MEEENEKVRCYICNKNVKLVDQICSKCKCGKNFCKEHRFAKLNNTTNGHTCDYNYIEEGRKILQNSMTKVVSNKMPDKV